MSSDQPEQFDSAGLTWRGREVTDTGFGTDDGSADPAVSAALADPGDLRSLLRVLNGARFLVPIVADPTEVVQEGQLMADKAADMAVAVLVAPEGTRALPVFTSMDSLHAWDPSARPSPVTSARAAQAAVSERCDIMVVDLAGPHPTTLRPSMVWALAMERDWLAAHEDPHVVQAVSAAVEPEPVIDRAVCEDGGDGALRIALHVIPGLTGDQLGELASRVGGQLATDGETRARIDAITFAIRPA